MKSYLGAFFVLVVAIVSSHMLGIDPIFSMLVFLTLEKLDGIIRGE